MQCNEFGEGLKVVGGYTPSAQGVRFCVQALLATGSPDFTHADEFIITFKFELVFRVE